MSRILLILFFPLGTLVSCIKKEAPNSEADIVTCFIEGDVLKADPKIENNKVTLMLKKGVDVTSLAPQFTLTPGATIAPESGTTRDFTQAQSYIVTSEDRQWQKEYLITCTLESISTYYSFENSELEDNKYYIFYEVSDNGELQYIWASGNAGFRLTAANAPPEDYPTVSWPAGKKGKCLKLETRSTGALGALVKKPIAAGNLFMGEFSATDALANPLKATRFGIPFDKQPLHLIGFYKYKAGERFTDENNQEVPGEKDIFDIYSILYETDENVKYLDGSNALDSPNLIAVARINPNQKSDPEYSESDFWSFFNIPFQLMEGKEIDPIKLANGQYNISIVLTSSVKGGEFKGAVGSILMVDELELICLER